MGFSASIKAFVNYYCYSPKEPVEEFAPKLKYPHSHTGAAINLPAENQSADVAVENPPVSSYACLGRLLTGEDVPADTKEPDLVHSQKQTAERQRQHEIIYFHAPVSFEKLGSEKVLLPHAVPEVHQPGAPSLMTK